MDTQFLGQIQTLIDSAREQNATSNAQALRQQAALVDAIRALTAAIQYLATTLDKDTPAHDHIGTLITGPGG